MNDFIQVVLKVNLNPTYPFLSSLLHMGRKILFICFFLFSAGKLFGQDIIVLTNNDSLRVKMVGINADKIRFRYFSVKEGPVREISKNQVKEVIYKNGERLTIIYNSYEVSKDKMIPERTHGFKVDLFAPLLNHYTIGYEWKLKKLKYYRNAELKGAYIGTYVNRGLKFAEGWTAKAGIKFIRVQQSRMKGLIYYQPLNGFFVKPEVIVSVFGQRDEDNKKVFFTHLAGVINFGRQIVIRNHVFFDVFGGTGVGHMFGSYKRKSLYDRKEFDFNYAYSHIFLGRKLPVVLTGGFCFGMVF